MGSGTGDPFGPRCNKGDIMGCGVLFPRDFESRSDSEEEGELMVRLMENQGDAEEYETDSGEEEEWWRPDLKQGDKVEVNDYNLVYFSLSKTLVFVGIFYKKWKSDWEKRGFAT